MDTEESEDRSVRLAENLSPTQKERLHTAVGLMLDWLLDNTPSNWDNETQQAVECEEATAQQAVQLRLEID